MSDYWISNAVLFRAEMRVAFTAPVLVERPRAEHDRRMEAHWLEMAWRLGRPAYMEAGREKPYGPFSRSHWRYLWLAMRAAWWSGWNDAVGATYRTTPPGRARQYATITGLTS
jgi:hypothetical protein